MSILAAGAADYSDYRKPMMIGSIYLFGALALPFAGLTGRSYGHLGALSALYVALSTASGVYTIIEASYIPLFMRSAGWARPRAARLQDGPPPAESRGAWIKGSRVSVLGLLASNVGALAALLIGVVITYSRGSAVRDGYHKTAPARGAIEAHVRQLPPGRDDCRLRHEWVVPPPSTPPPPLFSPLRARPGADPVAVVFALAGQMLLPSVPGAKRPAGTSVLLLPLRTCEWTALAVPRLAADPNPFPPPLAGLKLLGCVGRYRNAFKLCVGWVLWNTGYGNFLQLIGALFLETTGIQRGSSVYTVYTFMTVLFACMGSLAWLFGFRYSRLRIKTWAYALLGVNMACVLWGCLGIADVPVGYKHQAEFWVADFFFMSSGSALRSLNRVLYASLMPRGSEAAFFGLEMTLDLATGWINPLVQGAIQNRTHNLRFPMVPNLVLMVLALGLYAWVDVDRGMADAEAPLAPGGDGD